MAKISNFLYCLRWLNVIAVVSIGAVFSRQRQFWFAVAVVVIGLIQDSGLVIADEWLKAKQQRREKTCLDSSLR